jgi:hypothetical protein
VRSQLADAACYAGARMRVVGAWLGSALAIMACQQQPAARQPATRRAAAATVPSSLKAAQASPLPLRPLKARPWRTHPESSFQLVGEGLRGADVQVLSGRTVVHAWQCGDEPRVVDERPALHLVLWSVEGDQFGRPLPSTPAVVVDPNERLQLGGTWPYDLFALFRGARGVAPFSPPEEGVLLRWDGQRWSESLPPAARQDGMVPVQLLPWWDGTALVGRRANLSTVSVGPPSFAVLGQSSHVPPDFSKVTFPKPPGRASAVLTYAALPTHELFVVNVSRVGSRSIASLARSNLAGQVTIDTLLDSPTSLQTRVDVGKLGGRDVVAVALEPLAPRTSGPLLRLYDASGALDFGPALQPPTRQEPIQWLRFGGGKLWWGRGTRTSCFDGSAWRPCGKLAAEQVAYPAADGPGSWSMLGSRLMKLDESGQPQDVPFLTDAEGKLAIKRIVPVAGEDVWLVAETPERESLLFRSRPMQGRLGCP